MKSGIASAIVDKMMNHLRVMVFFLVLLLGGDAVGQIVAKSKILFEKREFKAAKTQLNTVTQKMPEYAESQYYLGRIAVEEKSYDESIARFENAIEANEKNAEYHNWLGVMYGVLAMDAGHFRQALLAPKIKNEFEKAAAIDPGNLPTQWGLINYYTKAPGFLGGSWDKALACAKVILQHSEAQGYRALGFIHAAQNKNELAETELKKATRIDENDPENEYALAQFYLDNKKTDKALSLYEAVIVKDPANLVAAFRLGHATAISGKQYERGIVCLNRYLRYTPKPNEPSLSGAAADLATIYERLGDKARAKSYFLSALRMEPSMKEAKEGLARMNE